MAPLGELMRSAIVCADIAAIDAPAAHLAKGNETTPSFVPKHEAHAPKALKQSKPAHGAKLRMVAEHSRQAVVRNSAA